MESNPNSLWIECKNIYKNFGKKVALENVDLKMEKGVNLVIGKNGSGKSTLLSLIEGLSKPTSGTIRVLGEDPTKKYGELMKRIAFLPERPIAYSDGKVKDFYEQFMRFNRVEEDSLNKMISIFDIDYLLKSNFRSLSLGEMQLVVLSATLSIQRDGYVLDEPNSNLDESNRAKLWKLMEKMGEEGKRILVVSHIPDQVVDFSESIFIFNSGRVISKINRENYWKSRNIVHVIRCKNTESLCQSLKEYKPICRKNTIEIEGASLGEMMASLPKESLNEILSITNHMEINLDE
jgi:ABC-type multidrug transport system, ATPase component